jgi:hypothetical protein
MAGRCKECLRRADSDEMEAKVNNREERISVAKKSGVHRGP